jgi:Pentapeptide repeats (8 copies)
MVVALLTTALLIVNLHPEIWKGLLEERNLTLTAIGVSVTAIIVLLAIGGAASSWTGFRGMTVRDWLDLLVVPLALVVISFLFTTQQDQRQQRTETQRAEAERELAEQRAQDEALQAYLDQMSTLMLERKLLEAEEGDPVHTLAQARTSTVILRLDAEHNESVTRFLSDSGLVVKSDPSPRLLSEIAMSHATLSEAQLSEADLSEADLTGADLFVALLENANLSGADLGKADLRHALLAGADLSGAEGITNEELEQLKQAESLEGATMPNGQKYEDWLKDNKAQGKDEKNE